MSRLLLVLATLALLPVAFAQHKPVPRDAPQPTALDAQLAAVDDIAQLQATASRFQLEKDYASEAAAWRRLVELRPHGGWFKLQLAAAYARQDMKSAAYTALLELQAQGYGFDLSGDERFALVATTRAWEYIVGALNTNAQPFGEGGVAYTLPAGDLLLESVAWDPGRKQLLVGSIREGAVHAVDARGKLEPLLRADAENGMWAVMDVAVDSRRGVLWVASTAIPHFKGYRPERDLGRAGVFKFDLASGKFLKSYLSPSVLGHAFFMSSLALAPDGTIYAADGVNNAVYMVRDDQLKRVFHAPTLTSIRGMTVSGDGRSLYFADFERGVIGYDLAAGRPFDVGVPNNLALGGIDGLLWWKGQLLAIQNGMQPTRVMRLALAPDGRSFSSAQPLLAGQPDMPLPTLGTLDGDTLYVIANGQKHLYDRFGLPVRRDALEATRIYRLDAGFATDAAPMERPGQPQGG